MPRTTTLRRPAMAAGIALTIALACAPPAQAQDPLAGALLGGAAGAIIGGAATGRGSGAAVGAVIGATTGAIIASEANRNANGYYAWRNGCYVQRADGAYVRVNPRYCYY
jgi:outer membrane lipoprotein SlyB